MVVLESSLVVGESGMRLLKFSQCGAVLLAGRQPAVQLLHGPVRARELPRVLVGRPVQRLLEVVQPLGHGRVLRVAPGLVAGEVGVGLLETLNGRAVGLARREPAPQVLHVRSVARQLLAMLVCVVADKLLEELHAILQGGVLQELLVMFSQATVGLLQPASSSFQLLRMLVRRVAQGLLQVVEALHQGGVVRLSHLVLLDKLAVRVPRSFQLPCMPVDGLAQSLLEIVHAVPQRAVLRGPVIQGAVVLSELRVELLELVVGRLELPRVPAHGVAHPTLEVVQALDY
mmetsp:Transcript_38536/g.111340  ORF Transcript_38536/g.111340 Transcript_38536/m.111340 type:complete len:287 (-) Transcript_38536:884-1744(-)